MYKFNDTPLNLNGVRVRRLLVGEANPTVRNHMLAVLRADGHEVVAIASGIDLLDTLAVSLHPELGSGRFDLVISDARMVGDREASVLRRFEKRAEVPPFVFTSVFRDKDLQAKANQFGALAVLDKPLDLNELRETVNRSLQPSRTTLAAASTGHGFGRWSPEPAAQGR